MKLGEAITVGTVQREGAGLVDRRHLLTNRLMFIKTQTRTKTARVLESFLAALQGLDGLCHPDRCIPQCLHIVMAEGQPDVVLEISIARCSDRTKK